MESVDFVWPKTRSISTVGRSVLDVYVATLITPTLFYLSAWIRVYKRILFCERTLCTYGTNTSIVMWCKADLFRQRNAAMTDDRTTRPSTLQRRRWVWWEWGYTKPPTRTLESSSWVSLGCCLNRRFRDDVWDPAGLAADLHVIVTLTR